MAEEREDVPLHSELRLPLLPLDDRVILPHMTVPVAVDSETARAAVSAARQTDSLVLLVPRIDGQFARLGTVAHIEESGRLPDGRRAAAFQGSTERRQYANGRPEGAIQQFRVRRTPECEGHVGAPLERLDSAVRDLKEASLDEGGGLVAKIYADAETEAQSEQT